MTAARDDADGTDGDGAIAWRQWAGGREGSPPAAGGGDDALGRSDGSESAEGRMSGGGGWGGHNDDGGGHGVVAWMLSLFPSITQIETTASSP
jgi:hypothetical protein